MNESVESNEKPLLEKCESQHNSIDTGISRLKDGRVMSKVKGQRRVRQAKMHENRL